MIRFTGLTMATARSRQKDRSGPYEKQLDKSFVMVLREAGTLYGDGGRLGKTFERLVTRLQTLDAPHALLGGYALILLGVRRFTEDIDVLVRPGDMKAIREELVGNGYAGVPGTTRSVRDAETGVRIDFVMSGSYPGDGKPKPVAFPDPLRLSGTSGIRVVDLKTFVELKLASGMTAPNRLQDLADVQRLIDVHHLSKKFAAQLHPYVRGKFTELAASMRHGRSTIA